MYRSNHEVPLYILFVPRNYDLDSKRSNTHQERGHGTMKLRDLDTYKIMNVPHGYHIYIKVHIVYKTLKDLSDQPD